MNIYSSMYHAPKPEGIENRKAYIVGGGIAGLATAAFLVDDAQMPGENVTIYEKLPVVGGSMDGEKRDFGYLCRGERELEPNMECLWYLCSKIPSIDTPGRTVLDETVDSNKDEPIHSECRVLVDQGHIYSKIHDFKMSPGLQSTIQRLFATPEEEMEDVTIEEFFSEYSEEFFQCSLWICFHSMLAFKPYHSAIEAKRYWQRFSLVNRIDYLEGILHTKYNEYDSIIKPLKAWLEGKGVNIITDCTVYDLALDASCCTVQSVKVRQAGEAKEFIVRPEDYVFVTNGSMTTNSCFADNKTVPVTNRNVDDRGLFTLWENLAKKHEKFGHPEKFISDIDKTKWISVFPTIKGYPEFFDRMERMTGSPAGTGGAMTILDSGWGISLVLYGKYFPGQADDENVFWMDGLFGERNGDYIKKPMAECTGEEMITELLYHLNMLDMKDEILAHSYISTCMMPYITSHFMPRKTTDRPRVVPEGCTNLAFIGQYVEVPGDVSFTVETSVRTPLEAVYALTNLDKEIIEVYPSKWDIRYNIERMKKFAGIDGPVTEDNLPSRKINPLKLAQMKKKLIDRINQVPPYYQMYPGRDQSIPKKKAVLHPQYPLDTEKR